MTRLGVSARVRSLALVATALVAASACGDDTPGSGWTAAQLTPGDEVEASHTTQDDQPRSGLSDVPPPATTTSAATTTSPGAPSATSAGLPGVAGTAVASSTSPTDRPSATAATTTAPTTTIPAPERRRHVLVIGDSSAASMRWSGGVDALRGAEFTLDAESCRRLVERSCPGDGGSIPSTAIDALRIRAGGDHDTLVMATGYNDMDRDFGEAFDVIYAEAKAQDFETIVWLTYREDVGFQLPSGSAPAYAEMNESLRLRVLSGRYPELQVLDWWDYTRDAPRWVTSDGVHLTRTGAFGMADLISRHLASLDERACPVAWELLTEPADPCPLPVDERNRRDGVPAIDLLYGL